MYLLRGKDKKISWLTEEEKCYIIYTYVTHIRDNIRELIVATIDFDRLILRDVL